MIGRSTKNLLSWVLVIAGLLVLFVWLPTQISWPQLGLTYAAMFFSAVTLVRLVRSTIPGRHSWIGVHSGLLAIGFISMPLLPQWCGFITASAYVLLVFTPNVLSDLALRRSAAGHARAAASYARLLPLFHPSRQIRFDSSFLSAHALGSIEQKVAAYRALARVQRLNNSVI
jgi:drug/metabolite transporter superfamily protein YnfA